MTDGMSGVLAKPLMFLSSYAPLLAMLAIRFDDPALQIVCAVAVVVGVGGIVQLLRRQQKGPPAFEYQVIDAKPAGTEASAYLSGYLLPFVTAPEPSSRELIAYGLFLVVAYAIHVRTGIIQVNPMLFVLTAGVAPASRWSSMVALTSSPMRR